MNPLASLASHYTFIIMMDIVIPDLVLGSVDLEELLLVAIGDF